MKYQLVDKETNEIVTPHWIGLAPNGQLYAEGMNVTSHYYMRRYTGLKDKNGTEIYEGDIVKFKYDTSFRGGGFSRKFFNAAVIYEADLKYGDAKFSTRFKDDMKHDSRKDIGWRAEEDMEVVGNIYHNKELLPE